MAGANNKALAKAGMKKSQIRAYRAMPLGRTAAAAVVAARHSPAVKRLGLRVTAGLMVTRRRQAKVARSPRSLKNGQSVQVGNATIAKQVLRSSVSQRDAAGTKVGRRSFSSTSYIVKRDGRILDVVRSPAAAVALAKS